MTAFTAGIVNSKEPTIPTPVNRPVRTARRSLRPGLVGGAVLVAGVLASTGGLGTPPAAAIAAPATIFVANNDASSITSYPLTANGNSAPKVTLSAQISSPQGLSFDSSGDLWVGNGYDVVEYTKSQLTKTSSSPKVAITSKSGAAAAGLAFDSSGDLWVDSYGGDSVVEYAKSQLGKTGSPTPKVTITNNNFSSPFGLAFDHSGNLWVGNEGTGDVMEYTKSELFGVSPSPKIAISTTGAEGIVFDSSGDLWVANGNDAVSEYAKSQLTMSGAPAPRVIISVSAGTTAGSSSQPHGVTFDSSGDLWVASYGDSTVVEFAKAQLTKSESPTPRRTLVGSRTGLGGPLSVAIEP